MAGQASGARQGGGTSLPHAPRIFISYRREDSEGHAGRLYDALSARFGDEQVFMDVDTIPLGADFTEAIAEAVGACDVLLAVIGRDWLSATASDGRRRLDDPHDFVRIEIKSALKREVRVIPTLVHGAEIPRAGELPRDIAALSRRNGIQLRSDSWAYGIGQLIETIETLAGGQESGRPRPAAKSSSPTAKKRSAAPKAAQASPSRKRSNAPPRKFEGAFSTKPTYQVRKSNASTGEHLVLDVVVGGTTHVVQIPRTAILLELAPAVQVDGSPVKGTKPNQFLAQISGSLLPPSQDEHLGAKQDASPADSTWWSYTFGFNDGLRNATALLKLRTIPDATSARTDLFFLVAERYRSLHKAVVVEVRLELDGQWLYWSR